VQSQPNAKNQEFGPALTSVQAQLSVRDGRAAIDFYREAFGAVELHRVGGTDESPSVVSQLSVGNAAFWVADESPKHQNFSPETVGGPTTRLLLITEDPDAVIARAEETGASVIYPAHDEHGWRLGRIRDPFGHHWEIGRPLHAWPPGDGASDDN
jgi:PhnB protein